MTALKSAAAAGAIVVCDIVYAEFCCHFDTAEACTAFLDDFSIGVESLSRESLYLASRAWLKYLARGGRCERVLPDFLVGAHATCQASRFLTRDAGYFKSYFPNLRVAG